jgi:hypothetical protein
VGNHNFCDSACTYGVQKGEEPGTLPIEAAAGVGDELVGGTGSTKVGALALKVAVLVGTADAGVVNATLCALLSGAELYEDVTAEIEALAGAAVGADGCDKAAVCPGTKGAGADIEVAPVGCGTHEGRIQCFVLDSQELNDFT